MSASATELDQLRTSLRASRAKLFHSTSRLRHELSDPLHLKASVREEPLKTLGAAAAVGFGIGGIVTPKSGNGDDCSCDGQKRRSRKSSGSSSWMGFLRALSIALSIRNAAAAEAGDEISRA